jgi:DNA transformation protein and related proteins
MDAEALKRLFKPFGEVVVKRMFGGSGVYAEGLCFAIEHGGEVFLKVDALSHADFTAAGSSPFIYVVRGKRMPTSFWRLPAIAHEEADELRRWASFGLAAARRVAEAKAKPKPKTGTAAKGRSKRS